MYAVTTARLHKSERTLLIISSDVLGYNYIKYKSDLEAVVGIFSKLV